MPAMRRKTPFSHRRQGTLSRIGAGIARTAGKKISGRIAFRRPSGFAATTRKTRLSAYEKLLSDREARAFFREIGKIMPQELGTDYFRRIDKASGKNIAAMLWKSGFSAEEAKNLFQTMKAERVKPEQAHETVRKICARRMKELRETGAIETVFS